MKALTEGLSTIVKRLNALSAKTENLIAAIEKPEIQASKPVKGKTAKKTTVTPKATAVKPVPKKNAALTDSDRVMKAMKRYKRGVNVARLKDKTGFNDKKISNIVHRAFKKGEIKRVGRGMYVLA